MTTFIIIIHCLVCILISAAILMQQGRGGGLTEAFASAESVFGAKTNSFMVRTTTVLASIFLVTCLVLTYLSSRKERSLMNDQSLMKKESPLKGIPVESPQSDAINSPKIKDETRNAKETLSSDVPESKTGVGVFTNSAK